jgi:hypothetical protein
MNALLPQLERLAIATERWHATPFSVRVKKVTWSVATDGHILLAVKALAASQGKGFPKELKEMISKPAVKTVEINVKELKAWTGTPPMALVPSGDVPVEHQGVLLDHLIDRRKLAYLFAKIMAPVVRGWIYQPGVLGFEQPEKQWRAFLAGLGDKPDGSEPVFRVCAESLSPMDLAEMVGKV